jgi:hypothetical protein
MKAQKAKRPNKTWLLAYDAMERLTCGQEASPEILALADSEFDLFLNNKLSDERIKFWAEYQQEFIDLNGGK